MDLHTIALFGEAEKGSFHTLFYLKNLINLYEFLGSPPPLSRGIPLAIGLLHARYHILYIRVEEEGFSLKDYYAGLKLIETEEPAINLSGIMMPGVADSSLIKEGAHLCEKSRALILTSQQDLYDYLTN